MTEDKTYEDYTIAELLQLRQEWLVEHEEFAINLTRAIGYYGKCPDYLIGGGFEDSNRGYISHGAECIWRKFSGGFNTKKQDFMNAYFLTVKVHDVMVCHVRIQKYNKSPDWVMVEGPNQDIESFFVPGEWQKTFYHLIKKFKKAMAEYEAKRIDIRRQELLDQLLIGKEI
jgi:hypothetical protein